GGVRHRRPQVPGLARLSRRQGCGHGTRGADRVGLADGARRCPGLARHRTPAPLFFARGTRRRGRRRDPGALCRRRCNCCGDRWYRPVNHPAPPYQHSAPDRRHREPDIANQRLRLALAARELDPQERLDWLRLCRTETIGPITFYAMLRRFGSARAAPDALPALARRGERVTTVAAVTRAEAQAALAAFHRA